MNAPLKALNEMQRLTSPFPESVAVKEWKATKGRFVIGWYNPYVPEEIIHAAGMLPFEVAGKAREEKEAAYGERAIEGLHATGRLAGAARELQRPRR